MDDSCEPGAQPQPDARLRAGRHRARPARAGERAGREVPGALRPRRPRACERSRRAPRGAALPPSARRASTPATTGPRRSTSPTTRPPKTAPASSTRRPPTASTTSTRVARTGWRSTRSSIRCRATASTTTRCRSSAAMNIWKATPAIVEALRDAGRLLASSTLVHSYPHCWRHKTPVSTARRRSGSSAWTSPTRRRAASSRSIRRRRRCANARSTRSKRPSSIPRTAAHACTT